MCQHERLLGFHVSSVSVFSELSTLFKFLSCTLLDRSYRVYFQIKPKRQKELNLLDIHLNSYNGPYKEPDIRSANHHWVHQTFTLHLHLNQYFQHDFTLRESNISWQLCWDTSGQRARLADVGQIHTPVKRHSSETTAGFTRSLLGQMCLQNVSITPIPHLCWAGFLPGWNPKSAEPSTANYFHALLTLTHVCLQHPAIPRPGNGAQMVWSFHCIIEWWCKAANHK